MRAPQFGQSVTPIACRAASLAAVQNSSNASLARSCTFTSVGMHLGAEQGLNSQMLQACTGSDDHLQTGVK